MVLYLVLFEYPGCEVLWIFPCVGVHLFIYICNWLYSESELLHNNKDLETEKKWQEWVFQKKSFLFRICKKGPKWSAIRVQLECKTSWSSISSEVYINVFNFLPRDIHPGKVASEAMFFGWVWASMPSHAQICPDLPWVPSGCVRGVLGKR